MRATCFIVPVVLALAACGGGEGGGGGGGVSSGMGSDEWKKPVKNKFALAPEVGTVQPLTVSQKPAGQVGMSGGFGARIGGTDKALYGGAHMRADFNARTVDGWVDEVGVYAVGTGVPLIRATPVKQYDVTGRITFSGALETLPPVGEPLSFDATYTGSLVGGGTTYRVRARTEHGSFMTSEGKTIAVGNISGSAVVSDSSISKVEILREGKIYVTQ